MGQVEALLALDREPLRFEELPARLTDIRDCLASFGIGQGDRVVAVLPHGPEAAVCFLGVASSAIYVPLNPEYSEAEYTRYLTQLGPSAVIVEAEGASVARRTARALAIPVLELLRDGRRAGDFSLRLPAGARHLQPRWKGARQISPRWNEAGDVGLILLTSGTTAAPKFVPVRHRALLAYARAAGAHFQLGADDRGLHVMPMFHGHGLKSSLFVPLANGSGVICSEGFDLPSFFRQLVEFRPTWYTAAASIHQAICQRIDAHRADASNARLRFIRSGSARLDPRVMTGLEDAFGAPLIERYGMTETCTLTGNPLPPGTRKVGSVGTPLFNEVAVLDETGQIAGTGRLGEVIARGPGVFDGYLDDPVATSAAFVDGWFRTGDLGSFDDDGYLTLAGRIKDVINRGGEKIAPTEVEAALLRHPALTEACVFATPHPTLGEEVAAAVVVGASMRVTERELRAHAGRLLTGFKVPRRVSFLPRLPKNGAGKIDRQEVARVCPVMDVRDGEADAPWSALEIEIAALWRATLKLPLPALDRHDDFFLLGGDSLLAYELFVHLRGRYGTSVGISNLFDDAATIAGMARLVERGRRQAGGTGDGGPTATRMIWMKREGDRSPLFAVPGSGGNPVGFVHLARMLDDRQPLVGIESRGIRGAELPLSSVEEIAADNLRELRRIQPAGPYFLAGACYGARVAYEMARQIDAAGESVGLLIMLDPSSPFHRADGQRRGHHQQGSRVTTRRAVLRFVLERIVIHARALARLRGAERVTYLRRKVDVVREILRRRDLFRGDRSELQQRMVYAANREAGRRYVPGPFAGPVIVCLTRDRPIKGQRNYRLDWLDLLPQAGCPQYVAGRDSGDMLNLPHVYDLASCINRWLDEAHACDRDSEARVHIRESA